MTVKTFLSWHHWCIGVEWFRAVPIFVRVWLFPVCVEITFPKPRNRS
jgi:hypothetical protein